MALPNNNTARLVIPYNDTQHNHKLLVRFPEDVADSTVMGVVANFFTAIAESMYLITVGTPTEYAINSAVGFPVTWTGDATYGTGTMPVVNAPRQLRWEGYSLGGHRVSFAMWGGDFTVPNKYRLQAADNTDYAAGGVVLRNAMAAGTICAIDGTGANIKSYVNVNFNSYWERKARV